VAFAARSAQRAIALYQGAPPAEAQTLIQIAIDVVGGTKPDRTTFFRAWDGLNLVVNPLGGPATVPALQACQLLTYAVAKLLKAEEAGDGAKVGNSIRISVSQVAAATYTQIELYGLDSLPALRSALSDLQRLRLLPIGSFPEVGQAFDTTEKGPLGQLWKA
jgi:hypothetical protein